MRSRSDNWHPNLSCINIPKTGHALSSSITFRKLITENDTNCTNSTNIFSVSMSTLALSLLKRRDTQRSPHGRASPSPRARAEGGPINSSLQQMMSRQQQPVVTTTRLATLQRTQQNRVIIWIPNNSPEIQSLPATNLTYYGVHS